VNPKDYKYTKDHEWIHLESEKEGKIGLADYAQSHLGDLVFFDLPAPGTQVKQFKKMGEVESVKAVSDIYAPASGKVLEVNQAAIDDPTKVNKDPYGEGWLVKVELSNPSDLDNLMDTDTYDKFVEKLLSEEE